MSQEWTRKRARQEEGNGQHDDAEEDPTNTSTSKRQNTQNSQQEPTPLPGPAPGWGERRDGVGAPGVASYPNYGPGGPGLNGVPQSLMGQGQHLQQQQQQQMILPSHPNPGGPSSGDQYGPVSAPTPTGGNPNNMPYGQHWQGSFGHPPPPHQPHPSMGFPPQMYQTFPNPYNLYQPPPHMAPHPPHGPSHFYPDPSNMGVPPNAFGDMQPQMSGHHVHPPPGYGTDGMSPPDMVSPSVASLPGTGNGGNGGNGASGTDSKDGGNDDDDDDQKPSADDGEIGTYGPASRMQTYIKPRVPTRQEVLDRRARKNAQSRARAAKMRDRIIMIRDKDPSERDEEEAALLKQYESRRQRKNNRSRERAIERKSEIDRILNKPDHKRSKVEKQFLETALNAKQRKNEGDRVRRQKLKVMGKTKLNDDPDGKVFGKDDGKDSTTTNNSASNSGTYGLPDIPVSPLPTNQTNYQSPPAGFATMAFPSPTNTRRQGPSASIPDGVAGPPGTGMEPGTTIVGGVSGPGQLSLSFMPPNEGFDSAGPTSGGQLHLSQQVEHCRHPDGSLSISIGAGGGGGGGPGTRGGPSFGGEAPPSPDLQATQTGVNMNDMSHLLLYDNNVEPNNGGVVNAESVGNPDDENNA